MRKVKRQECSSGHVRIDFHYRGLVVRQFPQHGIITRELAALFSFDTPNVRRHKAVNPQDFPYYLRDLDVAVKKDNPETLQNAFVMARDDLKYVLDRYPAVTQSWNGLPFYPKHSDIPAHNA